MTKTRGNLKKRAYNPKSRENLKQYRLPKLKEMQDKTLSGVAEKFEFDKEVIETIIPVSKIFTTDEAVRFWKYFDLYLSEFAAEGNLTISDFDDIAKLCKNAILEHRLLKSKKRDTEVADIMNALDKINKENQILKKQLAATRDQRFDPRSGNDITILDVIYEYEKRGGGISFEERIKEFEQEEENQVPEGSFKTSRKDMIT
jgi:hypothetical protein